MRLLHSQGLMRGQSEEQQKKQIAHVLQNVPAPPGYAAFHACDYPKHTCHNKLSLSQSSDLEEITVSLSKAESH